MLEFLSCLSHETLLKVLSVLYWDLHFQVVYEPLAAVQTSEMIALVESLI
jgi:hypothetical protein